MVWIFKSAAVTIKPASPIIKRIRHNTRTPKSTIPAPTGKLQTSRVILILMGRLAEINVIVDRRTVSEAKVRELAKLHDMDIHPRKEQMGVMLKNANPQPYDTVIRMGKLALGAAVDPSIARLLKVITKSKNDSAAVSAANSVLDRSGLKEAFKIEVNEIGNTDLKNLELLTEEELVQLSKIMRKLQSKPVSIKATTMRNITPALIPAIAESMES